MIQNNDTILTIPSEMFVDFKFQDFDNDGYKDIYLEWGGNMPDRFNLYVFIPSISEFRKINEFSDCPSAKRIEKTKFYYSYYRAGCADKAWGSHLFYIENYNVIKAGKIKGDACGVDDKISIYRFDKQKETVIETLPINTIDKFKNSKWDFVEEYWTKNCKHF